jgi:hypothetical protein
VRSEADRNLAIAIMLGTRTVKARPFSGKCAWCGGFIEPCSDRAWGPDCGATHVDCLAACADIAEGREPVPVPPEPDRGDWDEIF